MFLIKFCNFWAPRKVPPTGPGNSYSCRRPPGGPGTVTVAGGAPRHAPAPRSPQSVEVRFKQCFLSNLAIFGLRVGSPPRAPAKVTVGGPPRHPQSGEVRFKQCFLINFCIFGARVGSPPRGPGNSYSYSFVLVGRPAGKGQREVQLKRENCIFWGPQLTYLEPARHHGPETAQTLRNRPAFIRRRILRPQTGPKPKRMYEPIFPQQGCEKSALYTRVGGGLLKSSLLNTHWLTIDWRGLQSAPYECFDLLLCLLVLTSAVFTA